MGDERGMTLVELMVGIVILSLVAGAIYSLFYASLKAYWKGDIATQVQQGGRLALDRMSRDLRQARRLLNGQTSGGFTFAISCSPPQISFVLPHLGTVALQSPDPITGATQIYATDPSGGVIPYDGKYVSYYLSGTQGGTTPNATGPYLERTEYDIAAGTLSTVAVASDISGLALAASGWCPTTSSREITITVTSFQQATSQAVSSTSTMTQDISLRNPP